MSHAANLTTAPADATARDAALLCGGCGYDLRATATGVCPECGRAFDAEFLIDALMPWEQRRHVGRIRAYLATLWMVSFHPTRAADKIQRPMDAPAARAFRRIVWAIALVLIIALALAARYRVTQRVALGALPSRSPAIWHLLISPISLSAALCGMGIGLFAAMKLADVLFRSPALTERAQNRAMAMAAYSSAPLGWLPVPLLLLLFTSPQLLAAGGLPHWLDVTADIIAQLLLLLIGLQWWLLTIALMRLTAACEWIRTIATFLFLPLVWLTLIFGSAGVAVCAITLIVLIRQSL